MNLLSNKVCINKEKKLRILTATFLFFIAFMPTFAKAGVFSNIESILVGEVRASESVEKNYNSQTMPLLEPSILTASVGGLSSQNKGIGINDSLIVINGGALETESGPIGTSADVSVSKDLGQIVTYTVRKGDTLSAIAEMYEVSVSTILWANNLNRNSVIQEGQKLIILPVSGVKHVVKSGETLSSIVKKYGADLDEILEFNELSTGTELKVGMEIIIPDVELAEPAPEKNLTPKSNTIAKASGPSYPGYYERPIKGGIKSQGLHGYNAVDIAAPIGTPIYASAKGVVMIAKSEGWNSGYGEYVVISHPNGTQTLYAHASKVLVGVGQEVKQGDLIALVGSTGKSTGPHIHFEIRGAKNPF